MDEGCCEQGILLNLDYIHHDLGQGCSQLKEPSPMLLSVQFGWSCRVPTVHYAVCDKLDGCGMGYDTRLVREHLHKT